jgi:F0F1-type ATP synthase membrane subunit b/b'
LIEDAKEKTSGEIERAKSGIRQEADRARVTLETESREVALSISRTILGRTVGGGAD